MLVNDPKIAIIGGGPVGATMSLFLNKYKIHHVIFEKDTFPRDKICGDALSVDVYRTLAELDPDIAQELNDADWTAPCGGIYFSKGGRSSKSISVDFNEPNAPYSLINIAKREKFDEWIFNKAAASEYCDARTGTKITEISKKGTGHVLTWDNQTDYYDFIVGCDGERSTVKKELFEKGIKKDRAHHLAAVRAYYKGVEPISASNPMEVYTMDNFGGILWIFHLPNGERNVGLGGVANEIAEKKVRLRDELEAFVNETPGVKERFAKAKQTTKPQGWGIPVSSFRQKYYGDGYFIAGDAAHMAEPGTGKGIGVSMFVVFYAIPTIVACARKNDFSKESLAPLQKSIEQKFEKDWNQLQFFQKLMYKKSFQNLSLSLGRNKWLTNYFGKKAVRNMRKFTVPKGWENGTDL